MRTVLVLLPLEAAVSNPDMLKGMERCLLKRADNTVVEVYGPGAYVQALVRGFETMLLRELGGEDEPIEFRSGYAVNGAGQLCEQF